MQNEVVVMENNNQRIEVFDMLKGFGILCVILGHLGNPYIDRVVYIFHMPLFFLISGYFLSYKVGGNLFILKKIRGLIYPYFTSCFLIIASYLFFFYTFGYSGKRSLLSWIVVSFYGAGFKIDNPPIGYIGAIWFLLALFWAMIIVRIIGKFKYPFPAIVTISYLGWKTASDFYLPFSLQSGMLASLFVYFGSVFKKVENKIPSFFEFSDNTKRNHNYMLFFYGIILFISVWDIIFYKGFYMANCIMGNGIFDIIAALSACYLLFIWFKKINNNLICSILSFYGRNSLSVLCFHIVEQNTFPYFWLSESLSQAGVGGIVVLLVTIFIKFLWVTIWIVIINRTPLLKTLFHGEGIRLNLIRVY